MAHVGSNSVLIGTEDGTGIARYVQEALFDTVIMGADEIDRGLLLHTEINHLGYPGIAGGCRSAYAVSGRYTFYRCCRFLIKPEIILLRTGEKSAFQVGFVPDLEIPVGYLLLSISLGPVLDQCFDQVIPFFIIFWGRYIPPPPKNSLAAAG